MGQMMTPVDPPQGGVTQEFIPPGPDGVDPGYGAQNNAPLSQEDLEMLGRMQRNQALEDQEQKSFGMRPPPPPPPAALPGIPMALGGEPMAAAMDQMGADPMAGMMGGDPMAAMGAPPSADLGPATTEGIASQIDPQIAQIIQGAAQNFGDPETAENAEQMMNMVRGDQATVEERRMELGEMVGPEDAAQTPESVLTLVQPVLMMASMDTDTGGIGPMAQEAMNVPVTGEMAGGIMSMAGGPPEPEGGVPPVNFNQGGEVLRFSDGKVVPGIIKPKALNTYSVNQPVTPQKPNFGEAVGQPSVKDYSALYKPTRTLEEAFEARLPLLNKITGSDGGKDAQEMAFYQALAEAGARFAQPGLAGQTMFSQLAASVAPIAGKVADAAATGQAAQTALKLKAFEGAEKELAAEEATRRSSFLARAGSINAGVEAFQARSQEIVNIKNAFEKETALNQQQSNLADLRSRLDQQRGLMSQSQLQREMAGLNKSQKELDDAFVLNRDEQLYQKKISEMQLTQVYDLEKLDQSSGSQARLQQERITSAEKLANNKLNQDKLIAEAKNADAKAKIAIDERLAKVREEELVIKRHAASLKKISDKAKRYEKPGAFVPALLNEQVTYTETVDAVSDLDEPSVRTDKAPFYKLWSTGRVSPDNERAREIATMLENASLAEAVYQGPDKGFVKKPAVRFSPELNRSIVARFNLPNSDISERVKNNAQLQLAGGDRDALNKMFVEMGNSTTSMFDGMAKIAREDVGTTISKSASDLKDAFGATGLAERAINAASRFAGMDVSSGADRGAYIARRVFVDGLTASLAALPGKENVKIQELLQSVIPGNLLVANSPTAFYQKATTYLGSLEAGIDRIEQASKVSTISSDDLQKHLLALNELYATRNGVISLMKELDLQNNITEGD
jgi:hypothetical protein